MTELEERLRDTGRRYDAAVGLLGCLYFLLLIGLIIASLRWPACAIVLIGCAALGPFLSIFDPFNR